jgi:hypothetical protein
MSIFGGLLHHGKSFDRTSPPQPLLFHVLTIPDPPPNCGRQMLERRRRRGRRACRHGDAPTHRLHAGLHANGSNPSPAGDAGSTVIEPS